MTATKRMWVIRVVLEHDYSKKADRNQHSRERDGLWLGEILRYAGLTRKGALPTDVVLSEYTEVYEMVCPFPRRGTAGVDSKMWAQMNAARMRSFGLNAEAVEVDRA